MADFQRDRVIVVGRPPKLHQKSDEVQRESGIAGFGEPQE